MTSRRTILKGSLCAAAIAAVPACAAKSRKETHREARYWNELGDDVECELCPHKCILKNDETGKCQTRYNANGRMVTTGYANPCAVHVDPIEKKPLFHVLPGARAYSIAVAGCNLQCKNCQNYTISQIGPLQSRTIDLPPDKVIEEALRSECSAIAYTYSEPNVWFEYMIDTAKCARKAGLKNLWITAGYINEAPVRELAQYMDAANIDLKSFDDNIYRKLNGGRLEPVLQTLKTAKEVGIWVEVTNLVVPQWTDNPDLIRKLSAWIKQNLGADTPVHFSRFFPLYKLAHLQPTPEKKLIEAGKIAAEEGLRYVYIGNVAGLDSATRCPKCQYELVVRKGYTIDKNEITGGICPKCKQKIAGIWG